MSSYSSQLMKVCIDTDTELVQTDNQTETYSSTATQ